MATETKSHWDASGQIFFTDGIAYGLTVGLKTVILGKEEEILGQEKPENPRSGRLASRKKKN
jgi:hypothetical protein